MRDMRGFRIGWGAAQVLLVMLLLSAGATWAFVGSIVALAQGEPADEVSSKVELSGVVRKLGADGVAGGFELITLWEEDQRWVRSRLRTDDAGRYRVEVPRGAEVRFYATGGFLVPMSWSHKTVGEKAADAHDIWLRPLGHVRVTGLVTLPDERIARGAQVVLAPLELGLDGLRLPIAPPLYVNLGERSAWSLEVPAGVYDIWAQWTDRSGEEWNAYYAQSRSLEVYADTTVTLDLRERPVASGKLVDAAADGAPVAGTVELLTHGYLRQLKMFTGDRDNSLSELPVGEFREQLHTVDTADFTLVAAPHDSQSAIVVLPSMTIDALQAYGPIRLRDPKHGKLSVRLTTKARTIPLAQEVRIMPSGLVDVPPYVRGHLRLLGETSEDGLLVFWGLPMGIYSLYSNRDTILGEVKVTGQVQEHHAILDAPFATGVVRYPDGTPCLDAIAYGEMIPDDGSEPMNAFFNLFQNPATKKEGKLYMPLLRGKAKFYLTVGARGVGEALKFGDSPTKMPFRSERFEVKVGEDGVAELDVVLKPNAG